MKLSEFSTAYAGILQSAAYRNLQKFMTVHLSEFNITMPEWGLLGLVHASGSEGKSMSAIADAMNYELSHVTNLSNSLQERGYLTRQTSTSDRRHKNLVLTSKGNTFVGSTEKELRTRMSQWLKDINRAQIAGYVKTLHDIARLDVEER